MGDKVDFLPADKHESFLKGDSITLVVCKQACPMLYFILHLTLYQKKTQ